MTAGMAPCPAIQPTRKGAVGSLIRAMKLMVMEVDISGGGQVRCSVFGYSRADQPRGSMLVIIPSQFFQMTLWVSPQQS